MYSTGVKHSVDDYSSERDWKEDSSVRSVEDNAHSRSDEAVKECGADEDKSLMPEIAQPVVPKGDVLVHEASKDNSSHHLSSAAAETDKRRGLSKPTPAVERVEAISEFYANVLGAETDWTDAVRAVTDEESGGKGERSDCLIRNVIAGSRGMRDMVEYPAVRQFLDALFDETKSNQYVFRLYRELPPPGVAHLSKKSRGELLRRFANPPDRRWANARRYLALVDDMIAADLPLSRSLWTSAIHLAARATGRVHKEDLKKAIGLWRRMEHVAGLRSDTAVFEVLFDIAIKAGQYIVADRLVVEMEKRGLSFGRNGQVSNIYYHGLRRDPTGIRQAFDEFVQSGGIVDTVVLNCLIASFLRAGELETAEQIYDRMMVAQRKLEKELPNGNQHLFHHPSLSTEWVLYRKKNKRFGRVLKVSASLKHRFPEYHKMLQDSLPLTPDTRTFHILLAHHARHTGDLHKFMAVLRDMEQAYPVPPRAMVFLFLFEGFARHGRKGGGWTSERLWDTWDAFRRALYESKARLNDRGPFRRDQLRWENPLAKSMELKVEPSPGDIYTPLPWGKSGQKQSVDEKAKEDDEDDEKEWYEEEADEDEVEGMFYNTLPRSDTLHEELEDLQRRIENGVFLGRKIIMAILRAFGTCCEPDVLMRVWLQIERMWQVKKRKALDVLAVKEELDKQLEKSRRLCRKE
ncbi:hypothetical protein VTN77DRAFT_1200 [Rasamsonia byssochlamydoides]|uniref:uncharacterized protein n=1 Tax=Rasamsonia byssochlamydoides TaxID=89139 RepID=UPI0037431D06